MPHTSLAALYPIPSHIIPSHYACSRSKAGEGSLTETADPAER